MNATAISAATPKNGPRQQIVAEDAADQRADGDADAQRGLVEDDRLRDRAAGRADDGGQRGGDEQRVAQSPAGAEADDLADGVRTCRPAPAHTTMTARPSSRVRLAPIRLDTTPVISIATPMTTM